MIVNKLSMHEMMLLLLTLPCKKAEPVVKLVVVQVE